MIEYPTRNDFALRGASGVLFWGYRRIAVIGVWSLARGRLEAPLVVCDPIGVQQTGLELELTWGAREHPQKSRRHVVAVLEAAGGRFVAELRGKA